MARFIAIGSRTEVLASLTYLRIMLRHIVRLAFLIAALNELDILTYDIGNAYLNAECKEKISFVSRKEYGFNQGKVLIIKQALYGLYLSGVTWRATLREHIMNAMTFASTRVDAVVYIQKNMSNEKSPYYQLLLVYVDDLLLLSKNPPEVMESLIEAFCLRD